MLAPQGWRPLLRGILDPLLNSVRVDHWTDKLAIITINEEDFDQIRRHDGHGHGLSGLSDPSSMSLDNSTRF